MIAISLSTFDEMLMPAIPASMPIPAPIDDSNPLPPFSSFTNTVALRSYCGAAINRNTIAMSRVVAVVYANQRQRFLHSLRYCSMFMIDAYLKMRIAILVNTDTIDIQKEMFLVSLPLAVD